METPDSEENDSEENEVEETELEEDSQIEASRKDREALLAEGRRQELALLEAERKASERVSRAQSKLAKWERRLEKAQRRVTKWQRQLAEAEVDLRARQAERAIGPARGWLSPAPDPIQEPTPEASEPEPLAPPAGNAEMMQLPDHI